ncbi:MAG: cytochrome c oxidase subunit 3 [Rhodocyclaceae bacterium]|nr:cytochrome c oxidase subunit 3 [Rhodocyclaceae bacterium]MCE2723735.1 cytochrome c oxidase subunit 3 [Betaproteobacteria bacterium]MCA3001104.1 cytochrome c oxidase subunit 3 [Rhodocyclaceae bacterium]MCA3017412.1 cytochrome c oxidase subunit 3 [Rhodocyclaceae bacterium]MCA3022234.1 cytochrome c oxidase subunit 3 [Rhodocyclaceae bacterium]
MSATTGGYYFAPPSKWPVVGSTALMFLGAGTVLWMNQIQPYGAALQLIGFAVLIYMLFGWFGNVISESESGLYNKQVDASYRWSMGWFIFSEVMFFAAFFGALYYARVFSVPWLADLDNAFLWEGYAAKWPTLGPYFQQDPALAFQSMGAWGIPALNTALLLASGVTITYAHHALIDNNRNGLIWGLVATIGLGAVFLGFQIYEYVHAYSDLNLKLSSGVFGSTFYLLTGFHGFHVTLGAIMLTVILFRCIKGHFKPDRHFGFEAVAWYWHFVDVVWLGLFIFVYVLV